MISRVLPLFEHKDSTCEFAVVDSCVTTPELIVDDNAVDNDAICPVDSDMTAAVMPELLAFPVLSTDDDNTACTDVVVES